MENSDNVQTETQDDLAVAESEISLETLDEVNGGGSVSILWGAIHIHW